MKLGKTIGFALLIWVIGFIWGSVVFMTPALKDIPSIPMFSRYPLISFPLLILFPWLAYKFAPKCVEQGSSGGSALIPVGLVFVAVNVSLDWLVLVKGFKSEGYFLFLSVWIAYLAMVCTAHAALRRVRSSA